MIIIILSHKNVIKGPKNCLKKGKRSKFSNVYNFFKTNNGHLIIFKPIIWNKDNMSILSKIFYDDFKRYNSFIIRSNGNFHVSNYTENSITNFIYNNISQEKL